MDKQKTTDMRNKAKGMLFGELTAAMNEIADGRLSCNAEGYMRRFILMGMHGEKGPGGAPATFEEMAASTGEKLRHEAQTMLDAGLKRWEVDEEYRDLHLPACECCAVRDEYHYRQRIAEAMAKQKAALKGGTPCETAA